MTTVLKFLVLCTLAIGSNSRRVLTKSEALIKSEASHSSRFQQKIKSLTPEQTDKETGLRHDIGMTSNAAPSEAERPDGSHKSSCATGNATFEPYEGCKQVHASGLTFDCRFGVNRSPGDKALKGNVIFLHGFPEWSSMWVDAMKALSAENYNTVACNQRGYSPGASPDAEADYNYGLLRDDLFNVATAVGFEKFHLVAHDHGAVLGWWSAGSDRGKERIQSYTAISIPHNDAFSAGLFGPKADVDQQMASQYFSMFTLKDSAYIRAYALTNFMGRWSGFSSAADFQKALWWYNGAMAVGVLSAPPVISGSELWSHGFTAMATLRWLFGAGPPDLPEEGLQAASPTGKITMPSQYICGSEDVAILCSRPFALETENYVDKDNYRYLEVKAGHDPMTEGTEATKEVIEAIVWRVKNMGSS